MPAAAAAAGRLPGNPFDSSEPGLRPYARVRYDERADIERALQRHHGNKTRAALSLGLTPRQLRYRILKLGITTD